MTFVPRAAFPKLTDIPRSYFLGHHKSGLWNINKLLPSIDLVMECRDYRVPLTSRNHIMEQTLEGKARIMVYTKRDLGASGADTENENIIRKWHHPMPCLFIRNGDGEGDKSADAERKKSAKMLVEFLRNHAQERWKLVGHRLLVVGLPNVGKSTLLNALRAHGIGKPKVAKTGAQPGVTRKVSTGVKIIPSEDDVDAMDEGSKKHWKGVGGGVYLADSPGVFMPYVADADAMLKLALCGSVKDSIIPPVLMADYLLYHINLHDPTVYAEYSFPTNDIIDLLDNMARKTGKLNKGGKPNLDGTALWMLQRWRCGEFGRFLLDDVREEGLRIKIEQEENTVGSLHHARKLEKMKKKFESRREKPARKAAARA